MVTQCSQCGESAGQLTEKKGQWFCKDCNENPVPKPPPKLKEEEPEEVPPVYELKDLKGSDKTRNELLCIIANELNRTNQLLSYMAQGGTDEDNNNGKQ